MTVSLPSPRTWRATMFSPRRKHRTPRTPLDTVDSLDSQKFNSMFNRVATPRPARKVCDHCGTEAASARLHCVRGTTRAEDENNDFHVSLCDRCMKKESRGELDSQLRTARHKVDRRVKKVEKMKRKMRKFWENVLGLFSYEEDDREGCEVSPGADLKDLQELDRNLSASFHSWIMKRSLRGSGKGCEKWEARAPATSRQHDNSGAETSPRQSTWRQWAFPGKISRSSSDDANSDSSFLDFLRPAACFGALSPREEDEA